MVAPMMSGRYGGYPCLLPCLTSMMADRVTTSLGILLVSVAWSAASKHRKVAAITISDVSRRLFGPSGLYAFISSILSLNKFPVDHLPHPFDRRFYFI